MAGTPLGLLVGYYLARWFMAGYETEGYTWALRLDAQTVLLAVVGVFVAALLAQLPALRTLRRIDVAAIVRERSL